ncbi:hypothetical protein LTR20_006741 [Exophiala xenobiotica]|nr:hypothetical protein LTS06_009207 [Exophiala xenobiotica]KAK5371342.1 hypothetical protein LTS13_006719 [Exophiala xenobiotica]KAK5394816.1 hypothetical protein LTR79_007432 [Exophiala xenobiotica]KAK5413183.1 hypothetical protein LTR90_007305 [Exophiala xenobiotica]KAK5461817.1 hypothetical protein LTR20_006741 [Exophiala xenobiotica]
MGETFCTSLDEDATVRADIMRNIEHLQALGFENDIEDVNELTEEDIDVLPHRLLAGNGNDIPHSSVEEIKDLLVDYVAPESVEEIDIALEEAIAASAQRKVKRLDLAAGNVPDLCP